MSPTSAVHARLVTAIERFEREAVQEHDVRRVMMVFNNMKPRTEDLHTWNLLKTALFIAAASSHQPHNLKTVIDNGLWPVGPHGVPFTMTALLIVHPRQIHALAEHLIAIARHPVCAHQTETLKRQLSVSRPLWDTVLGGDLDAVVSEIVRFKAELTQFAGVPDSV